MEKPTTRMLCHDVYFTLEDNSADARDALIAGCRRFLADHPGVVHFAAGAPVEELDRSVNDRTFDVALHVVFTDKDAHDRYQTLPEHLEFVETFKGNWKTVRVFDSWADA